MRAAMLIDERKSVLLIATLSAFVTPFASAALNVAIPNMGNELSADGVTLGWTVSIYQLTAAMFLVPLGKIADIKGRKRVFQAGAWIFGSASLLLGWSNSVGLILALRAVQGLGGAMIFGTGIALLSSVYPPEKRGRALGINVAAVYSGLSLGPFLGGFLTQVLGWRSVFFATAALGMATAVLTTTTLKGDWVPAKGEKFDGVGALLFSSAIVAVMVGLSALPAAPAFGLIAAGTAAGVAFARWEARVAHPILHVALFRDNTVFALSNLAALLNYCATAALGFLLSLYLHFVQGLSPQATGMVLVSQPVMMALFSPLAGRLSDRIEPRTVASIGMGFTCLGLFVLSTLARDTPLALVVGTQMAMGFGFALFSSPNANAIMSSVEPRHYGVASGAMGTTRLTGQMLSIGISTSIIAVFMGTEPLSAEHADRLVTVVRVAFSLFGFLCLGGIFASLARGRVR